MRRVQYLLARLEEQEERHASPISKKSLIGYGAMGAAGGLLIKHAHNIATKTREQVGPIVKPIKKSLEIWQDSPNTETP